MAVSGVSSSNSIYGSRNVLTGIASGLDTEGMIENAISSFKTKINSLTQKRTKVEWQQEAYRSIVTKMANFSSKYADYQSSTNLMSPSFFNQAVTTVTQGDNASKVSASGKTGSDIQINAVRQLAKSATYRLSGAALGGAANGDGVVSAVGDKSFDLDGNQQLSNVAGTLTLAYGGSSARSYLDLSFGELDHFSNASEMAASINKQLDDLSISTSSGASKKASEMIRAEVDENKNIVFKDVSGASNEIFISSATGDLKKNLNVQTGSGVTAINTSILTNGGDRIGWSTEKSTREYLEGSSLEFTLDGVTKTVKMPTQDELLGALEKLDASDAEKQAVKDALSGGEPIEDAAARQVRDRAYVAALQEKIDNQFGKLTNGESKLKVSDTLTDEKNAGDEDAVTGIQLKFEAPEGSTFRLSGDKAEALGLNKDGTTSYLNTGKTLKELGILKDEMAYKKDENGEFVYETDESGAVKKDEDGNPIHAFNVDKDGKKLYSFELNGVKIGDFTEDSSVAGIMAQINGNKDANVSVSYSRSTNEFTFTAKDGGVAGKIDFGEGLAKELFGPGEAVGEKDGVTTYASGATFTKGQDAVFNATVNGKEMTLTRSSNTVEMDGLTFTLKGAFGYESQPVKDQNGNMVFSYGDGALYGRQAGDKVKIVNAKGGEMYYTTTSKPGEKAQVYGKVGDDGKVSFYIEDGDGEKEVYFQKSDSAAGGWFSVNKNYNGQEAESFTAETEYVKSAGTEPVTFSTSADADKIVDAVKAMVNDYNEMVTEIKSAYSTLPLQRSSGQYYEPLTDEEKEGMSETTIENWEKNAKTGILFGDRDLSTLYQRLTQAVSMTGADGADLKAAGITLNYANGLTTLSFNENQLRSTLETEPDRVTDIFTKNTSSGSSTKGFLEALQEPLDLYGKTTGVNLTTGMKGILVAKAGHLLAPSSLYNNTIQQQLDKIDEEIESWQDKMTDRVDYYTNKFSQLEQLAAQMNSQSSTLAGLMGNMG